MVSTLGGGPVSILLGGYGQWEDEAEFREREREKGEAASLTP